jgi:hypothetical protein
MRRPASIRLEANQIRQRNWLRGKTNFILSPTAPLGGCPLCSLAQSEEEEHEDEEMEE